MDNPLQIINMAKNALYFLTPASREDIIEFTLNHQMPDGGFAGRSGQSDIYYTFFGVQLLFILQGSNIPALTFEYISSIKNLEQLDIIHLTCFLRTRHILDRIKKAPQRPWPTHQTDSLLKRFISGNGGFCIDKNSAPGSIYASYLAHLTCKECNIELPLDPEKIIGCIDRYRSQDGSYAEVENMETGTLSVTCAAVILQYEIAGIIDDTAVAWIIERQAETGGFFASKNAFLPDLVSTAAAVFCLAIVGQNRSVNQTILDFVESLMQENGGFCGNRHDGTPDIEYTFYALLAIGSFMFNPGQRKTGDQFIEEKTGVNIT